MTRVKNIDAKAGNVEAHIVAPRTIYTELWRALSAPFDPDDVKVLKKNGKEMLYVTARTAMNRLDYAVGPENWWDRYVPGEHSVICELTIRLPDGSTLTKCDAGGYAGMSDPGDDDKSGFSDALKRAAAKFGVARYLYGDGVPDYAPPPRPDNGSGHGKGTYASDAEAAEMRRKIETFIEGRSAKYWDRLTGPDGSIPAEAGPYPVNVWQADGHMAKWAEAVGLIERGSVPEDGKIKNRQIGKFTAIAIRMDRPAFLKELVRYVEQEEAKAMEKLKRKRPDLFDEPDGDPIDPDEIDGAWPDGRE